MDTMYQSIHSLLLLWLQILRSATEWIYLSTHSQDFNMEQKVVQTEIEKKVQVLIPEKKYHLSTVSNLLATTNFKKEVTKSIKILKKCK